MFDLHIFGSFYSVFASDTRYTLYYLTRPSVEVSFYFGTTNGGSEENCAIKHLPPITGIEPGLLHGLVFSNRNVPKIESYTAYRKSTNFF